SSLLMVLFMSIRAFATTYYLSNRGNDLQSGKSVQKPWESLKKLSDTRQLLQPGDSILLERGSVFAGKLELSISGNPGLTIYLGDYGTGAKPVVTGSVEVNNWSLLRENIWVANYDGGTEPGNLFIDNHYQPLGRYPNAGYRTVYCKSD